MHRYSTGGSGRDRACIAVSVWVQSVRPRATDRGHAWTTQRLLVPTYRGHHRPAGPSGGSECGRSAITATASPSHMVPTTGRSVHGMRGSTSHRAHSPKAEGITSTSLNRPGWLPGAGSCWPSQSQWRPRGAATPAGGPRPCEQFHQWSCRARPMTD